MKEDALRRSLSQNQLKGKTEKRSVDVKTNNLIQMKLKRQIDFKFNKKLREDQINKSIQLLHHQRSNSLMLNNPLTKSSFSLFDAITHKAALKDTIQPAKSSLKSIISSKKVIALSSRQRYKSFDQNFFSTGQNQRSETLLKNALSTRDIIPRRSTIGVIQASKMNQRNNKFKLLIKQKKNNFKSASQRKISRIDIKIKDLKHKQILLKSLMPQQKVITVTPKIIPRGQIIGKDKIIKMSLSLIKNVEMYFNMYSHNNIVGGHIKKVEGYNNKIKKILMLDENRAKRLNIVQEITAFFWIFKKKVDWPQFYGEEDLNLYNILNNFLLKMEKRYGDTLTNFKFYQNRRVKAENEAFRKTLKKFEDKFGHNQKINQINNFIENRLRYDQQRRQEDMQELQKNGVKLNLIQRSRELILREKENAVKNALKRNSFK